MVAHETERLCAVAPAVAPAPSAAGGTSCGDNWWHQLAAETLVNMAWTAAGRQGTVQQQSLRTADQQQRSTMDSPATPNQEPCSQEPPCEPMPLAYGTPVEHVGSVHSQPLLQPLGPGALFASAQHAPLPAPSPAASVRALYPVCGSSLQHRPAAAYGSLQHRRPPAASTYGVRLPSTAAFRSTWSFLQHRPAASPSFGTSLQHRPAAGAPSYVGAPLPAACRCGIELPVERAA